MKKIIFILPALFVFASINAQLNNTKWKGTILGDNPRNVILDFKKDKFEICTVSDSAIVETMNWIVNDNTFTVKKIDGQSDCDNSTIGKYQFSIKKDSLFVKVLNDVCDDRSSALN